MGTQDGREILIQEDKRSPQDRLFNSVKSELATLRLLLSPTHKLVWVEPWELQRNALRADNYVNYIHALSQKSWLSLEKAIELVWFCKTIYETGQLASHA